MATGYSSTPIVAAMPITIHSPDERPAIVVPRSAATLQGFREWAVSDKFPERGRLTYVAGEVIVDTSPESIDSHNFVKLEITTVLHRFAESQRLGRVFADGILFTNTEAGVSNEPDASFVSYETLRSGIAQFPPLKGDPRSGMEIVGTVDWVLEIVSPSSVKKDKDLLRKAYFNAGVGEYWLIDARGGGIDFQMLVPGEKEFQVVPEQDGWMASPTFGKSFKLERTLEEDGFLKYTLHMK